MLLVGSSIATYTGSEATWKGYKVIGDNIDKNVYPSFQRYNTQTLSLHYFHSFACLDRIDFSNLDDTSPTGAINLRNACLMSGSEMQLIQEDLIILVSRYIIMTYAHLTFVGWTHLTKVCH